MKHMAIALLSLLLAIAYAQADGELNYSMSSVTALVGTDINVSNVSNLPQRATSTPGDAFLGFMRTFITGNIQDYAFHMSPQNRIDHFGTTDLNAIPQSFIDSRASMLLDTNLCITSYSLDTAGSNSVIFSISIAETTEEDTEESPFVYRMLFTNSVWTVDDTIGEIE